ncbi:MAG: MupA/Atu3671 family FMN-dependent luciferase-like monooxygenase [Pseudorhizobium sp.]
MSGFKAVLVGDGLLLVQCGERLLARGHDVVLIATDNTQVARWAASQHIPTSQTNDLCGSIEELEVDWLFSIANLNLLPDEVLLRARSGAINFHDAILPDQGGLNTPAWAIMEGRQVHGVSWHAMTRYVDQGAVLVRRSFDIAADETAWTLNSKCFEVGIESFEELLDNIERGQFTEQAQSTAPKQMYRRSHRPAAAATLNWAQCAADLDRLVRALDFGPGYSNPLLTPKIRHEGKLYRVKSLTIGPDGQHAQPGTVLALAQDTVTIATADRAVIVSAARKDGDTLKSLASLVDVGDRLTLWTQQQAEALTAAVARVAPFETSFVTALRRKIDAVMPEMREYKADEEPLLDVVPLACCDGLERSERTALVCAFIGRLCDQAVFDVTLSHDRLLHISAVWPEYFASEVPLRVDLRQAETPKQAIQLLDKSLTKLDRHLTHLQDVVERYPETSDAPLSFAIIDTRVPPLAQTVRGCAVTFRLGSSNCEMIYDRRRLDASHAHVMAARLAVFATAFSKKDAVLDKIPLMDEEEFQTVVHAWNETEADYEDTLCVHHLIERQATITPIAEALSCGAQTLSYLDMMQRAETLSERLAARGVGPGHLVGIHLPRSCDLVVAALAIWKAGGAYLPLDPEFPPDRLAFMIEDSRTALVICNSDLADSAAISGCERLVMDEPCSTTTSALTAHGGSRRKSTSDDLAYVIYTSGSTGKPKGVMVEHRNVVNFFAGMDERVPLIKDGSNVWLAVTSLSFDISVLELFWTLSRGFKVVLHTPELSRAKQNSASYPALTSDLSFGLFYWGNDASSGPDKYRLLLEGAKFADAHGFDAIWTPERHFHAFGGPFPNPSVSGAAVAAVTKNVAIRAGSCVLPLHHPIRVVEEWAVVDNLSNGRVGLAFASGWMPEDFVLRPQNAPPMNKSCLLPDIEMVRRLWRGEQISFDLNDAQSVGVVTQPRPVQSELPVWLTTAGNPQTYKDAARAGAHVLTHLLGQSIEELAEKIQIYREELAVNGHDPSAFKVTLMLHTLIGDDRDAVREQARDPLKEYLRSAAALIKQYAWAFPAFKRPAGSSQAPDIDLRALTQEEMDAILEFAFQRYFDDSGLFGTVEDALHRLAEVQAAGVDEIACLIDWGLPEDLVLSALRPLARVVARCHRSSERAPLSFSEEVVRHGVTHLQCTPSMMRAFMMSDEDRSALRNMRHILLGGEALPGALVAALRTCSDAAVENMYGPTETTIWSSTCPALSHAGVAPIGRPIVNTKMYVLDSKLRPVPPGAPGELYIGGEGVARGYLNREDLTKERFLPNPYAKGRIYRTGDVVRFDETGLLHFLGRNDHQVKIRGHRIELGEIEAAIERFPGALEAIVVARKEDVGDPRIVAYVRCENNSLCEQSLKDHLKRSLPDCMVPSEVMALEAFPLTPNAKVDRNRLPLPAAPPPKASPSYTPPTGDLELTLSSAFARVLGREQVGRSENFFAIGGHSLLAVQLHRELKSSLAPGLTITDLFRFPTVAALAVHIGGGDTANAMLEKAADRATNRLRMLQERQSRATRADALV